MTRQATDPIIVYGAPRSGTTYLNAILNEHPEIFITHETRIFVWAHRSMGELLESDQVFLSRRSVFRDHLVDRYPELIRSFYSRLRPQTVFWGDKNPHYASPENEGCLDTIDLLFPGSRFVHIVRDGRDVAASLIRKRKPDGAAWTDFEGAHNVWVKHVDNGTAFGRELSTDRYHELRYEDLIADDVTVAKGVFDFLGIDMTDGVVEFCERQRDERTPLSGPTRALDDASRSDWSTLLSPRERRRSLDLLGDHLVKYGYETAESLAALRAATVAG